MKRIVTKQLLEWKTKTRRKPLILRGARQIGKTFSVKEFAAGAFKNFILIDFERNPDFRLIFKKNLNPIQICMELELVSNCRIIPNESLIFFDEIQECPEALMSLRYFYEEIPDLHIIAAGSLLEFAFQHISFPVGRVQFLNMYPMCFIEFLHAANFSNLVRVLLDKPQTLSEAVHQKINELLRIYFFVGGMPEAVNTYIKTNSLKEAFEVQAEIAHAYQMDFAKYQPQVDRHCLATVFHRLAQSVGKQTKYASLADDFTNPTLKKAYQSLMLSKICSPIAAINPSSLPLEATASPKIFKTLMVDIGIMHQVCGLKINTDVFNQDLSNLYNGSMAEQFVGQELLAAKQQNAYYWSREAKNSQAEVDYVTTIGNQIIPIEVKSGSAGRLRSMHLFLETFKNTPYGAVVSTHSYSESKEQNLVFIPLYYLFSLVKEDLDVSDFL